MRGEERIRANVAKNEQEMERIGRKEGTKGIKRVGMKRKRSWDGREGGKPAGRIVDFYLLSISVIVSQFLRSGDLARA